MTVRDLAEYRVGAAVQFPTKDQSDLLACYHSRLERFDNRWQISDRLAPSEADWNGLHMRRGEVTRALTPAQDHECQVLVTAMFMGFPGVRMDADTAKKTTALYTSQLREFPAWAVKEACQRAMQDRISGRSADFVPSVATLVGECSRIVQPLRTEKAQLDAVVDADVYHEASAEEKARLRAEFDKLVNDLRLRDPLKRDDYVESADAALERLRGQALPQMSDALARQVGVA